VRDAPALLDVMAGYKPGDPYWAPAPARPFSEEATRPPGRLRIGVTAEPPLEAPVDPACRTALADAASLLAALGHEVEEATPDWHEPGFTTLFTHVWQAGSALWSDLDPSQLEPLNRVLLEAGGRLTSVDYVKSVLQLQALARRIIAFWDDHDLLLTPWSR
jgi:amidase